MSNGENQIDFSAIATIELMEYMAMKSEFPDEAAAAFIQFCHRFGEAILKKAEIYCTKFGYSATVALELSECTFARVWKYPTFKIGKSSASNPDKGIILWMIKILFTQLVKYGEYSRCSEVTEEEDLSLITTMDQLVSHQLPNGDDHSRRNLRKKLDVVDKALAGLSAKHRIIYLTYKAYEIEGKYLPRTLTKKLQVTLDLVQSSIKVYKKEANDHVIRYLETINQKR